jgi:thioredoxin 1
MKTATILIAFFLIFYSSLTGQIPDSIKFKSLLPNDFHQACLKDENAVLIDVREFFEFRKTRILNAVNIPSSGNLALAADTIDKKSALFFYCTTGTRSKRVAGNFYEKGFRKLYSLEGGIVAWKKEGMPVVRKKVKRK